MPALRFMVLATVAAIGLAGCGSSVSDDGARAGGKGGAGGASVPTDGPCTNTNVIGAWSLIGGVNGVNLVDIFNADGTYAGAAFIPTATAGVFDEQVSTGTFVASGGYVTFTSSASTCPTATAGSVTFTCQVVNGALEIVSLNGVYGAWAPTATVPSDPAKVTLGCVENGAFVPHPLTPSR